MNLYNMKYGYRAPGFAFLSFVILKSILSERKECLLQILS